MRRRDFRKFLQRAPFVIRLTGLLRTLTTVHLPSCSPLSTTKREIADVSYRYAQALKSRPSTVPLDLPHNFRLWSSASSIRGAHTPMPPATAPIYRLQSTSSSTQDGKVQPLRRRNNQAQGSTQDVQSSKNVEAKNEAIRKQICFHSRSSYSLVSADMRAETLDWDCSFESTSFWLCLVASSCSKAG